MTAEYEHSGKELEDLSLDQPGTFHASISEERSTGVRRHLPAQIRSSGRYSLFFAFAFTMNTLCACAFVTLAPRASPPYVMLVFNYTFFMNSSESALDRSISNCVFYLTCLSLVYVCCGVWPFYAVYSHYKGFSPPTSLANTP